MKRYELYIDRLMSIWHRTYTSIYAESEEEAIQKCLDDDYEVDDTKIQLQ